jgi:hypothetical protein
MKTARVISFVVAVLLLTSSTFAQVRTTRLTSSSDYRWIYLYAHPDYGTTFDITLTWDSSTTMFWDIWYLHPGEAWRGIVGNWSSARILDFKATFSAGGVLAVKLGTSTATTATLAATREWSVSPSWDPDGLSFDEWGEAGSDAAGDWGKAGASVLPGGAGVLRHGSPPPLPPPAR